MSLSWSDITKITELKARYFFGAWIFGALLIFLPAEIKQQMGITIPEVVRPWLGFSTLAAFVLWFVLIFILAFSSIRRWFKTRDLRAEILSQLETLSRGEKDLLLQCLIHNQRTIRRQITDPDVHSLTSKGLMTRAAGVGSALAWPHTVPKFVWDYIKANDAELFPELFDEQAMREFQQRQQRG